MTNTNLPKRFTKKPVTIEATYSPESAALAQSGQGEVLGFAWRAKGSSDKWKFCGDIKQRPDLSQEADAKRFVNTEIVDLFTRPQPAQPSSEDVRELTKWLNEESTAPINKQALARVLAAQPARVVGTVTGYQTASGAQQWQFNPSNVAGLENQRFDVALSTPTAAPTPGSITSMQHPMNPGGFQDCGFGPTWHDYAAAPTPSQHAELRAALWHIKNTAISLADAQVIALEALAAHAKKAGRL